MARFKWLNWSFCFVIISHFPVCGDSLVSKFTQFEILKPDRIQVKAKRESGNVKVKSLSLFALGRTFVLHLHPGATNLHSDFTVSVVDSHGVRTPHYVDRSMFYTGHLQGDDLSGVDLVNVENIWVGRIFTRETIFSIEPLSLHQARSHPHYMIVYDIRDLRTNKSESDSSFCREIYFDNQGRLHFKDEASRYSHRTRSSRTDNQNIFDNGNKVHINRVTRSTMSLNSCDILAIADFRALKGIGQGSVQKMAGILINLYQSVDRIFNSTKFGSIGPQRNVLRAVLIHSSYSIVNSGTIHYNMENQFQDAAKILYSLANHPYFAQFCLTHLTSQRNYGEMLGLASTAEDSADEWNNGICAGRGGAARNVGLSTPIKITGEQMPLSKYMTVVAHELGHNWGSEHDPETSASCSPSSEEGGKYLMWARSGVGVEANSLKFSPCSVAEISKVLQNKAHKCFLPYGVNASYCGNGLLDFGEQCDVGMLQDDPCCQENCRLRTQAMCSPFSHPCCTAECQVAPNTQICRDGTLTQCYTTPYCDGKDFRSCPSREALPNNSSCEGRGTCWYGHCLTYCETVGRGSNPPRHLEPCTCDRNTETMCTHCCRDVRSPKECVHMNLKMDDGDPCLFGFCKGGVCQISDVSDMFITSYAHQIHIAFVLIAKLDIFLVSVFFVNDV